MVDLQSTALATWLRRHDDASWNMVPSMHQFIGKFLVETCRNLEDYIDFSVVGKGPGSQPRGPARLLPRSGRPSRYAVDQDFLSVIFDCGQSPSPINLAMPGLESLYWLLPIRQPRRWSVVSMAHPVSKAGGNLMVSELRTKGKTHK